jgi:hypothetical protein
MESGDTKNPEEATQSEAARSESRLRRLLGIQEFLTIMMVIAALSSAIATWKATKIIARGERPVMGVDSIKLTQDRANRPYVAVIYRNYGAEQARECVLEAWVAVDGELASFDPLKPDDQKVRLTLGILSLGVPHLFAAYFRPEALEAIREGRSELKVMISLFYKDLGGEAYCYRMDFRYFAPADTFDPAGGSDDCHSLETANLAGTNRP